MVESRNLRSERKEMQVSRIPSMYACKPCADETSDKEKSHSVYVQTAIIERRKPKLMLIRCVI